MLPCTPELPSFAIWAVDELAQVVSDPTDEKVILIQTLEYQTKSGKGNSSTRCLLGHLRLVLIGDELVKYKKTSSS